MKRISRGVLAGAMFLLVLLVPVQIGHAATISVNTTADELNSDGDCSLREAMQAANTNAAVDACGAGDPGPTVDVIDFSVTGTITLGSALPPISEAMTIDGPGDASLTVNGAGAGGIILDVAAGAALNLRELTVANSSGGFQGGAITNAGTLTVTDVTFSANSATNGGAVYNQGTATITDSTFAGNSSSGVGGAIFKNGPTLTITNTTFSQNSAGTNGGAIFGSSYTVENSTFAGNTASGVAGAIDVNGLVTVTNATFSGNSASAGGGAIFVRNTLTLENAIVANSPAGGNCATTTTGTINDGGGNLSWPDTTCPGLNQDPLLDPAGLQDNGGPTETIMLQPGSPAINTAVPANCPATDQRGVGRPQGAGCDMGAVEVVFGYPRPKGATPMQVPLVPAYLACSTSNRTHGPSLVHPSCAPPVKLSQYATVGTPDANGRPVRSTGSVRMAVLVGEPSNEIDDADVSLTANITDVRAAGDLSDYSGELLAAVGMRITDKRNGPSLDEPATVVDAALSWPLQCAATEDPAVGATCSSSTTTDALVPGTVAEGKRAIWGLRQVQVADGGEDGEAATTGDNTPFLTQGVFVP
jgi:CSLREA domain-containing protein